MTQTHDEEREREADRPEAERSRQEEVLEEAASEEEGPSRRRPGRLRRWVLRPFIWLLLLPLLALGAAFLYLDSDRAREQARVFAEARLADALERPVTIGSLDFDLFPVGVEVTDLVIPGPGPDDPAVAVVPRGRLDLSLDFVGDRRVTLERLVLDRPSFYVVVREDGTTNLPRLQPSEAQGQNIEVEVGSLLVEGGELVLNERRVPLDLDAEGITARMVATEGGLPLLGRVEIDRVATSLQGGPDYPASIQAQVEVRGGAVEIRSGRIQGPDLNARVNGSYVFEGTESRLFLNIVAQGRTELANRLGYSNGGATGPFYFDGDLSVNGSEWVLTGVLDSEQIEVEPWRLTDIRARVSRRTEGLVVDVEEAFLADGSGDGRLTGQVRISLDAGEGGSVPVEVDLETAALDVRQLLANIGVEIEGIQGRAGGTASYRFSADAPLEGSGGARLTVRASEVAGRQIALSGDVPLFVENGVLTGDVIRLSSDYQQARLRDLRVDLSSGQGGFDFEVDSAHVGRLQVLLGYPGVPAGGASGTAAASASSSEPPPVWLPYAGRGTLAGSVRFGGDEGVVADVELDLRQVRAPGAVADRLQGHLTVTGDDVRDLRLDLERDLPFEAGQPFYEELGRMTVAGSVPFREGLGGIDLTVDASRWPLQEVKAFLPFELPVEGRFTGRLDLFGEADALAGRVDANLEPARLAGFDVDRAEVGLTFEPDGVRFTEGSVRLGGSELIARGTLDFSGPAGPDGEVDPGLDFDVFAEDLDLASPPISDYTGRQIAGTVSVSARVGGTLSSPSATASLEARNLALPDRDLGDASLEARWDGGSLDASGSLLGLVEVTGGGYLDLERADLDFAVTTDSIEDLVRLAARQDPGPLSGTFAGTVSIEGPLSNLEVGASLPELHLTYRVADGRPVELHTLEPVRIRLDGDVLRLDSFYLGARGGLSTQTVALPLPETVSGGAGGEAASLATTADEAEVFVFGELGLSGEFPLDLRFQLSLPAQWAEPMLAESRIRGAVDALGRVRGTISAPELDGQASWTEGELIYPGFPHALEDLRAVVLAYPNRFVIDSVRARVAGGTLQAAGSVTLEGGAVADYRFQADVDDVRLRYPEGWVVEGGAELVAVPTPDGRMIRGAVDLERASYVRDIRLNLFQLLSGFLRRQRLEVGETDPILTSTQLNVAVSGPGALRVRNNVADLTGSADLTVRGTLARPVLVGQVEAEEGGTLVYGETEYEIQRALLTFSRLDRIDPLVDLVATSQVKEYEITLNLSGDLGRLNANFSSEPPLPDLDVLALLSTGQRLEGGGDLTDRALGDPQSTGGGAEVFLYGQAASAVSSRVKSLFGLDKFRIDPTTSAGGSVNSARLIVGQQISRDLFVTYQRDVSSNSQDLVEAEWRVEPGLVVVFSVIDGEEYGVELRWDRRF